MDNLYLAQICYKKAGILSIGKQNKPLITQRLVRGADIEQAKKEVEIYWKKTYLQKGFVILALEIYQTINE